MSSLFSDSSFLKWKVLNLRWLKDPAQCLRLQDEHTRISSDLRSFLLAISLKTTQVSFHSIYSATFRSTNLALTKQSSQIIMPSSYFTPLPYGLRDRATVSDKLLYLLKSLARPRESLFQG